MAIFLKNTVDLSIPAGGMRHGAELISVTVPLGTNAVRWVIQSGASSAWCETNSSWVWPFANQYVDKGGTSWRLRGSSLQRFIEDQQGWMSHQRADDNASRRWPHDDCERRVGGALIDAENIQPLLHQLMLFVGDRLINADLSQNSLTG